MKIFKYLPLVALGKNVSKKYEEETGKDRPAILQRSVLGAVFELIAGFLAIQTGAVVISQDEVQIVADNAIQIASLIYAGYSAVLVIYGIVMKVVVKLKKPEPPTQ